MATIKKKCLWSYLIIYGFCDLWISSSLLWTFQLDCDSSQHSESFYFLIVIYLVYPLDNLNFLVLFCSLYSAYITLGKRLLCFSNPINELFFFVKVNIITTSFTSASIQDFFIRKYICSSYLYHFSAAWWKFLRPRVFFFLLLHCTSFV